MSNQQPDQPEEQENAQQQQQHEPAQQQEEDPNILTEQDKKVYAEIMGSINRMNKKIKNAKEKVPEAAESKSELKRTTVNQIAAKLIQSKENSDIVTKQDLISDVQESFEQVVVNVYSENKQLKKKMQSLIAIIKQQNRKINEHRQRQDKLKDQNERLRDEVIRLKDDQLLSGNTTHKKSANNQSSASPIKNVSSIKNRNNTQDNQEYDFWNMPNNQSTAGKRKKDFVADSGLWVNDKDIDKSVFITEKAKR